MSVAADRLLAGMRDEIVPTSCRPGRGHRHDRRRHCAASCRAPPMNDPRAPRKSLEAAQRPSRSGSLAVCRPERRARRAAPENMRATDEIVTALNERRILARLRAGGRRRTREPAFYECLMRMQRRTAVLLAPRRRAGRREARPGPSARPSRARARHRRARGSARRPAQPQHLAGDHHGRRTGGRRSKR